MSSFEENINSLKAEHLSDLSHNQLIDLIDNNISSLIRSDPLLHHLPKDITTDELEAIISQQFGRSFVVFVKREKSSTIRLIVENEANVEQLKKSIQKQFSMQCKRDKSEAKRHINWRFVWNTYCLVFDNQRLDSDLTKLKDYGISNNSEIGFTKKYCK